MPEERVSYLEPIDDVPVSEAFGSERKPESPIENPAMPEVRSEKKTELKSESEATYQKMLASSPQSSASSDADVSDDAQQVSLKIDADSKVTQLVDLAVAKGVVHAVKVARKLDDFYVLDQLHDDLANKLYQSLKERGLISE